MGMEVDDPQAAAPNPVPVPDISSGAAGSLAEAQYAATSTIFGSNDPVEILNALINFAGRPFARAEMGLLDAETGILNMIAVRDEKGVHEAHFQRRFEEFPGYEMLEAVEVLDIPDVTADPLLTDHERSLVESRGMVALLIIPLVVARRLTGLIIFENATPVTLSQDALRAMRHLGNQVAVVFENQSLLRDTAATLEEVQTLYDINRAILGAQTPLDVLEVLQSYLAQNALALTHAVARHKYGEKVLNLVMKLVITAGERSAVDALVQIEQPEALFGVYDTSGVLILETVSAVERSALGDLLYSPQTQSCIVIAARERGAVEEVIVVAFETPQAFDSTTRRLYAAVADQIGVVLQNQRLLREAQTTAMTLSQQVSILQVLNQLSTGISSFQGELELLDYSVQSLVAALGVDHAAVALLQSDQDIPVVTTEHPQQHNLDTPMKVLDGDLLGRLRQMPDHPVIVEQPAGMNVARRMLMALQSYGEIIGVVAFDLSATGRQFTLEMIETAQTMLSQIAIGLQNIRLLTDAQRRAEQLQRIALFGQSVQASFNVAAILDIMLTESRQLIPVDSLTVALDEPRRGGLHVVARYEGGSVSVDLENRIHVKLDGTLAGHVWETHEMFVIADAQLATNIQDLQDFTMRSLMIVPIRSRGRLLGIVNVGCERPNAYTETDQAIFQQMINQLAVAIENAQAFQQSQRVAQNEAMINEIATHLQQRTDVEDMLQIALNELGAALGARRGRVRLALHHEEGVAPNGGRDGNGI